MKNKIEKSFIEPKYNEIKEYFKSKKYDKKKLNDMCMDLIEILGELTIRGITEIEGLPMDTWRMRTWVLVEKSGNLPPYREPKEKLNEPIIVNSNDDEWYKSEEGYD